MQCLSLFLSLPEGGLSFFYLFQAVKSLSQYSYKTHISIWQSQNNFIMGRQILDVLIVNKCVDGQLRASASGVICKLDMENVFDHVTWAFLLYRLGRCGFGERWHCVD